MAGVQTLLEESERMFSADLKVVGPKNASKIWGFISKFVMLDRFMKAVGVADIHPGLCVLRDARSPEHFGTANRVSMFLHTYIFY